MIFFKPIKVAAVILIITAACYAENYNVSVYFEQTEEALNTLFRAQAFPHPIGDHNGNDYDIYMWDPTVDLEVGMINFNFTIYANELMNWEAKNSDLNTILKSMWNVYNPEGKHV